VILSRASDVIWDQKPRHTEFMSCMRCHAEAKGVRKFRLTILYYLDEVNEGIPWDCECLEGLDDDESQKLMKANIRGILRWIRFATMEEFPELMSVLRRWGIYIDEEGIQAMNDALHERKKRMMKTSFFYTNPLDSIEDFRHMFVRIKRAS